MRGLYSAEQRAMDWLQALMLILLLLTTARRTNIEWHRLAPHQPHCKLGGKLATNFSEKTNWCATTVVLVAAAGWAPMSLPATVANGPDSCLTCGCCLAE